MRLDSTQMLAVKRLMATSDFEEFVKAVQSYHDVLTQQLVECRSEQVLTAQGRVQSLARVLASIHAARTWQPHQPL